MIQINILSMAVFAMFANSAATLNLNVIRRSLSRPGNDLAGASV